MREKIAIWGDHIPFNSKRSKFEDMNINFKSKQKIAAIGRFVFAGIRGEKYVDHSEAIDTWTYLVEIKPGFGRETYEDVPYITPFLVPGSKRAVLVVPGGGFSYKQSDFDGEGKQMEGDLVAKFLNENGISAFVLWYRTNPYAFPAPLLDIQRAVRYIKFHAEEFGIEPDKLSAIGFSGGGYEIAGLINLLHDENRFPDGYTPDEVDAMSDRLETAGLIYPCVSFKGLIPMMYACFRKDQLATPAQRDALYHEYNIAEHFCSADIPQFLAFGVRDFMIPASQIEEYIIKLRRAGQAHYIMNHMSSMHGMGMAAHSRKIYGKDHFIYKYLDWYQTTTA